MRRRAKRENEFAVSEVIGVVMLLAMVITMMGGVFLMLTPYIEDFQDNTSWANANGIADRLEDRIALTGPMPENTGIRTTIPAASSNVAPLVNVETWTLAADLVDYERVTVARNSSSSFSVFAINESAESAHIWTERGEETHSFTPSHEAVIIDHGLEVSDLVIVTVFDADGVAIHRYASITLSGLQVVTNIKGGEHGIAMVNDGRADKTEDAPWALSKRPSVALDELVDGTVRTSILLRDVTINGTVPTGRSMGIDLVSKGPINLFSGDAWHFRFTYDSTLDSTISPQMHENWLTEYNLHRASGTLEQYNGICPWLRASGSDGFTVNGGDTMIDLEIDLQRVEVSG